MPDIWVPPSFTGKRRNFACRLCPDRFYTTEALAGHIREHWRAEEGEIRMRSLRERAPSIAGDAGVDTEFEKWHRDRGAGRKT